MKITFISIFSRAVLFLLPALAVAQSSVFTFSGGSTIGSQRWDNSFDRQPLFQWHGTVAAETFNNDNDKSALFAQLGYHVKGSAMRLRYFNVGGTNTFQTIDRFKFNNISLILGAKQKFKLGSGRSKYYYFGGIRGDFTVSNNLKEIGEANNLNANPFARVIYPFPEYVKRVTGGVSAGAGIELPLTDLIGAELKFSIHPDFTVQYDQPPIPNVIVYNPFNPGQVTSIPARRIRNVAIELSVGFRFLRKVIYVE